MDVKCKILLIVSELGYRGTPKTVANYARLLASRYEVAVWGYREGGETDVLLRNEGFTVFVGDKDEPLAFAYGASIVNFHRPGYFCERETQLLKKFHEAGAKCVETNIFGRVDESVLGYINAIIQVSRWDLWQWNRWCGKCKNIPVVYVPNPVGCEHFIRVPPAQILETRHSWQIPSDAIVVGRIGNTGWSLLEKPLLEVLKKYPSLHLVSVQDHSGAQTENVRRHPRVHIIQRLVGNGALSRFYSSCDFMIHMSSLGESFGLVNAEAMSCGTPVITLSTLFHCNAQLEVVRHGMGGLAIAHPKDLSRAVEEMLLFLQNTGRPQLVRKMILDRYSLPVVGDRLMRLFDVVSESRDGNELAERIRQQDVLEMYVTDDEISNRCRAVIGRNSFFEMLGMRLYYTRAGYVAAQMLKRMMRDARKLVKGGA